jgi:hypothetical protein
MQVVFNFLGGRGVERNWDPGDKNCPVLGSRIHPHIHRGIRQSYVAKIIYLCFEKRSCLGKI